MKKCYMIYHNEGTDDVSFIGAFDSEKEFYENIDNFNERTGFQSFYKRIIDFKEYYLIDFGSHFRFYYMTWSEEAKDKLMSELNK